MATIRSGIGEFTSEVWRFVGPSWVGSIVAVHNRDKFGMEELLKHDRNIKEIKLVWHAGLATWSSICDVN